MWASPSSGSSLKCGSCAAGPEGCARRFLIDACLIRELDLDVPLLGLHRPLTVPCGLAALARLLLLVMVPTGPVVLHCAAGDQSKELVSDPSGCKRSEELQQKFAMVGIEPTVSHMRGGCTTTCATRRCSIPTTGRSLTAIRISFVGGYTRGRHSGRIRQTFPLTFSQLAHAAPPHVGVTGTWPERFSAF